ncbi:TPA: hypothetical protein ACH3X3_012777 [Trebouxia sp. C0006]
MHSCFAEFPDHILISCLRLTSFGDKLRCQQVCTSWRSLLNRSAASGHACEISRSDSWGPSMNLYVRDPAERRARTRVADLHSTQAVTAVYLVTTVGPLSLHNEACLQWIAQRAVVVPEVHIDIEAVLPAQLVPHLAAALKAAAALAPSAWQMRLYAEFDITDPQNGCQHLAGLLTYWIAETAYVQQLSCLTQLTHLSWTAESELGSPEDLQQLSLLQTLELPRLPAVPRDVHIFKIVQSLSLHGIEEQICRMESYTQLTLSICHFGTVQ